MIDTQGVEEIDTIVAADEDPAACVNNLTSIPGIAKVTACAIVTDIAELGWMTGKQATKLAGLACTHPEAIGQVAGQGTHPGRARQCQADNLLPAVVATRFTPDMKAKYKQLIFAGKCKKLAITAVMRKPIVTANALLRDRCKWVECPA